MLTDNLPPVWQRDAADWLVKLADRLKKLEHEHLDKRAAAIEVWHQVILIAQAELKALPPQHNSDKLIDQDYCAWAQEQIRLLHLRQFDQLDLEHLPDELDTLIWVIQQEINKNLEIICNHLLKYKYAREYLNDEPCCDSWRSTLCRARQQIEDELEDSPSLQEYPAEELEFRYEIAMAQVERETKLPENMLPKSCPWTINQVLDPGWLPN